MSVQSTIEATAASLSRAERRVAATIRANPSIVLTHTINELADASQTSVATVVRFCRSVGLQGYSHLRMRLATELGMEAAQFGPTMNSGADIQRDDTLAQAVEKIAGLERLAIDETIAGLDLGQLERLAALIDQAQSILCFGMGASQSVARDLCDKLVRIDRSAWCPQDAHDAWARAALASPQTVAVGFSHSGATDGGATTAAPGRVERWRSCREPRPFASVRHQRQRWVHRNWTWTPNAGQSVENWHTAPAFGTSASVRRNRARGSGGARNSPRQPGRACCRA